MTTLQLMKGCDAVAEAAIAAGCRFFSGYPMLPFTGLLESMARRLPEVDGVCMNAASEIEGVNMALGAAATGMRSATGSVGQGVALMQETIAEAALSQIPLVVFTIARGQQDYFQCTRGGGWGDYRTITIAPKDAAEAAESTQLLFHLADKHRAPVILLGDYLIADTVMTVDVTPQEYDALPPKDWVLDPARGGTGDSHVLWTFDIGKANNPGLKPDEHWRRIAAKFDEIGRTEARHEEYRTDDADYVIVSWGTSGPFVDYVVDELRSAGVRAGSFRPITLWPFPEDALRAATERCKRVLVFEVNAGQMLDDVQLSVTDRSKVVFVGGVSVDYSGMRQGPLLDVGAIHERVVAEIDEQLG